MTLKPPVSAVEMPREARSGATAPRKDRLTKEINYWDHRANQLKDQELAGRTNAKINSGKARQRADELQARLQKRMADLELEGQLSPLPPVVVGGSLVIPIGLLRTLQPNLTPSDDAAAAENRRKVELLAMKLVMEAETRLGFEPRDVSADKCGYDVESRVPHSGKLRFIEVKGRVADATTVTVTRNEILTALNKPEDFILAVGQIENGQGKLSYIRQPTHRAEEQLCALRPGQDNGVGLDRGGQAERVATRGETC